MSFNLNLRSKKLPFKPPLNDLETVRRTLSALESLCPNKTRSYHFKVDDGASGLILGVATFMADSRDINLKNHYTTHFERVKPDQAERETISLICSDDGIVQCYSTGLVRAEGKRIVIDSKGADVSIPHGSPEKQHAARMIALELLEDVAARGQISSVRNDPPARGR